MGAIVLNSDQIRILREHPNGVRALDAEGRELGVVLPHDESTEAPVSDEIIEKLASRMQQTDIRWSTTQEVVARIKARAAQQ